MGGQIPQAAQASVLPTGFVSKVAPKTEKGNEAKNGDEVFSKQMMDIDSQARASSQKTEVEDQSNGILKTEQSGGSDSESKEEAGEDGKTASRKIKNQELNLLVSAAMQTERAKVKVKISPVSNDDAEQIKQNDKGEHPQIRQIRNLKQQAILKTAIEGQERLAEATVPLNEVKDNPLRIRREARQAEGGKVQSMPESERTGQVPITEFAVKPPEKNKQQSPRQAALHKQEKPEVEFDKLTIVKVSEKTYFPVDTEKQVWQQIGQKISQNLVTINKPESGAQTSNLLQTDTAPVSVSKVIKHLQIQLKPENLGKVDVKMTIVNGTLEVILAASDGHLAGRLQQNSGHLSKQLKSADFSFESLSVRVLDGDPLRSSRTAFNPDLNDSDQYSANQDGQQYSQPNSDFFDHAGDKRSDNNHERPPANEQHPKEFKPVDDGIGARDSILL